MYVVLYLIYNATKTFSPRDVNTAHLLPESTEVHG